MRSITTARLRKLANKHWCNINRFALSNSKQINNSDCLKVTRNVAYKNNCIFTMRREKHLSELSTEFNIILQNFTLSTMQFGIASYNANMLTKLMKDMLDEGSDIGFMTTISNYDDSYYISNHISRITIDLEVLYSPEFVYNARKHLLISVNPAHVSQKIIFGDILTLQSLGYHHSVYSSDTNLVGICLNHDMNDRIRLSIILIH